MFDSEDFIVNKEQARNYAKNQNCRFIILSNGDSHYLWDLKIGNPVSNSQTRRLGINHQGI